MITLSTMNSQSSENFEDSSEERVQSITNGEERFSADRELIETYDEQRRKSIFQRWYNVDFKGKFSFPEPFNTVPIHHLPDRIWIRPMDYDEVARRLLGESENDGPSQLPAEIIRYFADIVEFSSGKFADLQTRIDDNEHHIQVLERAKECSKAPHFLTLNTPKVRLFPEDSVAKLQQKFQKILDEASLRMLNDTIMERHLLRAKLCQEAESLLLEVQKEAITRWMDAQGQWNAWDHLYRVTAEVQQGENLIRVAIPISANVFRIAMRQCKCKVSALLDSRRTERAEEAKSRNREKQLRLQALAQASALPRQEAELSIQRRIEDAVQPLLAKINVIEERLQGKGSAPRNADIHGAATRSENESRMRPPDTNQDTSKETEAVSETQGRRKKRRKLLKEVRSTAEVQKHPVPATRDLAKRLGLKQNDGRKER